MKSKVIKQKRLNNGKPTEIFYNISEQDLKNQVHEIYKNNHYISGVDQLIKSKSKQKTVLDLGGNIGNAALYFQPYADRIISVEANPNIYQCLVKNTQSHNNIEAHNYAVYYHNGQDFFFGHNDDPEQTFYPNKPLSRVEVECITIDKLFEKLDIDHVDVMKIDVEGAEYAIFADIYFGKVADKIDFIVGESHHMSNLSGEPMFIPEMLKPYGFETEFIQHDPPNSTRNITYTNPKTEYKKEFVASVNTIFVARRK